MISNIPKLVASKCVLYNVHEAALLKTELAALFAEVGIEKGDYDLEEFTAESSSLDMWVSSAGTFPFLAPKRVVVVRNLQKSNDPNVDVNKLKMLGDFSLLILLASHDGAESGSGASKVKAWEKAVNAAGGSVVSLKVDAGKVGEMIKQQVISRGYTIPPSVLTMLVEMTGSQYSYALEELEKVYLLCPAKVIDERTVKMAVVPSREWNVWKLIDALCSGNVGESLKHLRIIVSNKGKVEDVAFSQLFPLIVRQLKFLFQGRMCLDHRCQPSQAPESVRALFPSKPNLGSESSYRQDSIMRAAGKLELSQINRAIGLVAEADGALKGQSASFSAIDTLERLVFDLARTLGSKTA